MNKILIAEDENDIRQLITFTLKFAGYDVVAVGNGAEAVEAAGLEMPDLILLDVRMPMMDGYKACEQIKSNPGTENIPVVFLSAKGQESEIQSGMDSGAHDYLLKPFSPDELTARVKEILQKNGK